jgi:hypothetical protein
MHQFGFRAVSKRTLITMAEFLRPRELNSHSTD